MGSQKLFDLKLFESYQLYGMDFIRVPGGWVSIIKGQNCFIAYNEEFKVDYEPFKNEEKQNERN